MPVWWQSTFWPPTPVPDQTEYSVWWFLSWSRFLSLSKWSDSGPLFWANSTKNPQSRSTLWHTSRPPCKACLDLNYFLKSLSPLVSNQWQNWADHIGMMSPLSPVEEGLWNILLLKSLLHLSIITNKVSKQEKKVRVVPLIPATNEPIFMSTSWPCGENGETEKRFGILISVFNLGWGGGGGGRGVGDGPGIRQSSPASH